ncbi:MAG: anti-sigma factor [Gemmatimonadetes bacterium]|nr:anti-sigma factor [Gemmatimonadota bacterium]
MNEHVMRELAAPYALGTLSGEEGAAFAAHLSGCPECQAEVRSFERVTGLLALAAPGAAPPPGLKDRVLREARRVRPIAGRRWGPGSWLAVAASAAVAVATALWAYLATARARAMSGEVAAARAELAARDSTLAALLGPRLQVVSLAAQGQRPAARVFWNHERNVFVVTAFSLPTPPAGRTYQLWAIADGHAPVSMGTFGTDPRGRATAVLPVDATILALGTIKLCGLTEEPVGGSPQPTEAPRLVGEWSHGASMP